MKRKLLVCVVAFVCVCLTTFTPVAAGTQRRPPRWTSCFFEIVGPPPGGLRDFENFFVTGDDPDAPLSGGLITKSSTLVLPYAKVEITGDTLTFTTVARRGVSYSFVGRLLPVPASGRFADGTPVAAGTLRRFVRGRSVAEAAVKLSCDPGDD